ncbi:hypothetical protein H072_7311 [Dactylellina haptotyla CBS 200.50]|uniref:Rhodopsin domain-containing protein n=1 Tax=Dactylellina haptotyla (strain CBS 200.50) TaxID=1284197 RepID=S8ACX0_DACHA|nr:hypothetical protein H072_7311 [Dactylellina haptotyla CBS 200.50]
MAPTPTATLGGDPANNNDSRHPLFLSVTFVLLGLATVFVILRAHCRYFIVNRFGLDDWLIVIGLASEWALAVMNYFQVQYGTGRHISTVIIYPLVLLFIKLSILSFYRGISPQRKYRNSVYGVSAFVIVWTIAFVFAYIFECPNPSTAWSITFPEGCVNLPALYYIALIAIFSVGAIAVAGSVARLWSLWKYQHTLDVSYDAIFILLFSHVEINLAMMCACAPALKPLFKTFSTPFSSRVDDSNIKSSRLSSTGGKTEAAAGHSHSSNSSNVSSYIARNRAIFENTSETPKRTIGSLESRVVKVTGGTPYYTPPLEFDSDLDHNIDGATSPIVPPTVAKISRRTSAPEFQVGDYGGSIKIQSTPHFRASTTSSALMRSNGNKPSKLAGEYTVTCSSTHSLAKNNFGPNQEYLSFFQRPSIWRRSSSMSRRTGQAQNARDSPDNQSDLGVKIEQEVRVDYELMTEEEQDKWERKRSVLDAVDNLW